MARLVNVGCGNRTHPEWMNLDLTANDSSVIEHDLRRGIPFEPNSCDAVYHSHVLEHLDRGAAHQLLAECYRVLKPGGIVRVVVPDLEQIAKEYLLALREAETDPNALIKVDWMKLEMFDQVSRSRSGGDMVRFVHAEGRPQEAFIRSRLGDEVYGGRKATGKRRTWRDDLRRLRKALLKARRFLTLSMITLLEGSGGRQAYKEAVFRQSGELHRWMYDRITLRDALERVGFRDVLVCSAVSSRIDDFVRFELDTVGKKVRKPDSLFMEAVKPNQAIAADHRAAA